MTAENLVAVLGAVTALAVALAAIFRELRQVKVHLNSRLDELVALTARSARAEGVLQERERISPHPGGEIPHSD